MNVKSIASQNTVEFLSTVLFAVACTMVYKSAPLQVAGLTVGLTLGIPLFLKDPVYGIFLVIIVLPFRDVHIISILHLKRLVIWFLAAYHFSRQLTSPRIARTKSINLFSKWLLLFGGGMLLALLKLTTELNTTEYISVNMLKKTLITDTFSIFEGFLILYIVYYSIRTLEGLQRILEVMVMISAFVGLLGVVQYLLKGPPASLSFLFDTDYVLYGRAASVYSNPNQFGGFVAPMVVIGFAMLFLSPISMNKKLWIVLPATILNCLGLLVSFSRGAALQALIGIVCCGYLYYAKMSKKRLSWKVVLLNGTILLVLVSSVLFYDVYMRQRLVFSPEKDYYETLQWVKKICDFQRKQAAIRAIETFFAHPLIGIGYNLFAWKKVAGAQYFGLATHNQYLKILAEMGIVGIISFTGLISIILLAGLRIWKPGISQTPGEDVQIMVIILLSGVCTTLVGFLFADVLNFLPHSGFLWLFAGGILMLEREYYAS